MSRSLPERPHLDHLKNEAKALLKTLRASDPAAKLTDAQRALAREYGFPTWAKLRAHVSTVRAEHDVVPEFLSAIQSQDATRARRMFETHHRALSSSVHAMASMAESEKVRALLETDPSLIDRKAGDPPATALLYACFTPMYEEGSAAHEALARTVRVLLDAGADPNARDGRYGVPAL